MNRALLVLLFALAASGPASATAPPTINPCDGPAAAVNPNCSGGAQNALSNPGIGGKGGQSLPGTGGGGSGSLAPGGGGTGTGTGTGGGAGAGNATESGAAAPGRGHAHAFTGGPGSGTGAAGAEAGAAGSGAGGARTGPGSPFGGGNPLTVKAGFELQMGDAASACGHAREALLQDPKDAKAKAIESQACKAGLDSGPKDGKTDDRTLHGGAAAPAPKPGAGGLNDAAGARLLRGDAGGGTVTVEDPALQEILERIAAAIEAGNQAEVVRLSEEGLEKFPDSTHLLDALATALVKLREFKAALAAAERALRLKPDDATAYANKAAALGGLGDRKGMLAALRRAAELDPRFKAALDAALAQNAADLFGGLLESGALKGPLPWVGGAALLGLLVTALLLLARRQAAAPAPEAAFPTAATAAATAAGAAPPGLAAGAVIGGYRIEGELGRGGMGVVFSAIDVKLQRRVALKQLRRGGDGTSGDLDRFMKEARLVASLKHPNLAEIYAVLEAAGEPLLVFEYVEGRTLDKLLAAARRLTPEKAARVLDGVAAALDHAHAQKIIHRDLKPSNVMVSSDGSVKVMDFGIAHRASGEATSTRTEAWGTPPYMAPEQGAGSVSAASDRYAMAVMAYELVAGVRPFEGPDFHGQKLRKEFAAVSARGLGLPAGLDAFFDAALDVDAARRPATAAALVAEFRRAGGVKPS